MSTVLVGEWAEPWLESKTRLSDTSKRLYGQQLRKHIVPRLGQVGVAALDVATVRRFTEQLSPELAPRTVDLVFNVLRAMLSDAVKAGLLDSNPCSAMRLSRESQPAVAPSLTVVRALAEAISPRYRLAVWLGAGLGLRFGEAVALSVNNVSGRRGHAVARISQSAYDGQLRLRPYGRKAQRELPVDDFVFDEIRTHLATFGQGVDGLLLSNQRGTIVRHSTFGACLRVAVLKAGIEEQLSFRSLRHCYARLLIDANLHPQLVQQRMGHGTIEETFDTYGHFFPRGGQVETDQLESLLADLAPL